MDNYTASIIVTEPFVLGDTYLVTWDGTDYECVAREVDGGTLIGNEGLFGYITDQAEPFVMYTMDNVDGSYTLKIETNSMDSSHTIAIRHVVVSTKRLDSALLPPVYLNGVKEGTILDALNYLSNLLANELELTETPFFTETQTEILEPSPDEELPSN